MFLKNTKSSGNIKTYTCIYLRKDNKYILNEILQSIVNSKNLVQIQSYLVYCKCKYHCASKNGQASDG